MGRSPCCSKEGLNRGAWTALEDKILADYIKIHGEGKWRNLPKKSGLKRCGKSCRLRWLNYLRPDIKRGNITPDEEELIIRLHKLLGNRWSLIAGRLPGRTDNEIKNYWNTNLGKRSITLSLKQLSNSIDKKKLPSPPSSSKMESPVLVRTKALRCTKVILPPQQLDTPAQGPALTGDVCHNHVGSEFFFTSSTPGEEDKSSTSSDFMMDLNVGEFCLTDLLLDSELLQLCHFDCGDGVGGQGCSDSSNNNEDDNNNNNKDFSPCSEDPLLFSEKMFEDWTRNDCVHPDDISDLQSLAYFLDADDEWLGKQ